MSENVIVSKTINAADAAMRWHQSLQLVSTFTEIWIQNPQLAKQAGRRVEEFVLPLVEVQKRHLHDLA
ncbi:MAG: hypothetical protein V4772_01100 [Pseudomonadota bacterium]